MNSCFERWSGVWLRHTDRAACICSAPVQEASDYDVLVVMPDDAPPELKRSRLAYQGLWDIGVAADVLIWTRSAFESRLHLRASLPATMAKEGTLLYAA